MDTEKQPTSSTPPTPAPPMQMPSKRPSEKKRKILIAIFSAIALLVVAAASVLAFIFLQNSPPEEEITNPVRANVDERKEFDEGESARFGYFEVKVNKVENNYKPEDNLEPAEGNKFLLVNLTAENTDSATRLFSDIDLAVLAGGTVVNASYSRVEPALEWGAVEPDTSVTGNVLYEIPKGEDDLKLYYNTQIYSDEQEKLRKIEYILDL